MALGCTTASAHAETDLVLLGKSWHFGHQIAPGDIGYNVNQYNWGAGLEYRFDGTGWFAGGLTYRDTFRQQLVQAQERQTQTQRQLEQATSRAATEKAEKERVQADLRTRTTERDNLQTQYDGFRRNIRDVLGQAEAALTNPTLNGATAVRN